MLHRKKKKSPINSHRWDAKSIRLRVRPKTHYASHDRIVLATSEDGFLHGEENQGLFFRETRFLSRYRYLIDDQPLRPVTLSNVAQDVWAGYYLANTRKKGKTGDTSSQQVVEMRLLRRLGPGLHEDVTVTNYTQAVQRFHLTLELAADFADLFETSGTRQQHGSKLSRWRGRGKGGELTIEYRARHRYVHRDEAGKASLRCVLKVALRGASTKSKWRSGAIRFDIELAPRQVWRSHLDVTAASGEWSGNVPSHRVKATDFPANATNFSSPESGTLTSVVVGALEQGKRDLAALRLYDLDRRGGGWVPAAGLPLYVALFGRDTLTAAWEAAALTTEIMRGTLAALAQTQGTRVDRWRDEEPGRMIHEMHSGPLSMLNYIPNGRDYGSVTTSAFYPFVVAQLWHWTGDKKLTKPFLAPAIRALHWLKDFSTGEDGFCRYQTKSGMGVRNQSWKDSGDAIVYEDGSLVPTPIATCEQQGIIYAGKMNLAEVLWWFGRKDEAKQLYREARELKKRFNDAFWMEKEGFVAMALDPEGRQVRSIGSNALHCVATGILDKTHVPAVMKRLFAPDMFSGWGVRTLSAKHPFFNPYAYHRGTVWPVEHGPFAVGAYRYGQHDAVERISRAQFELASLFDRYQLPECVAGHPLDEEHPFPALYPAANAPQAWSATTPYTLLQAILGTQPFAPLKFLFIDPYLPPWLPELTLSNMRVADACISLRFYRTRAGRSDYEVLEKRGTLHVIRQPSPWSFTASLAERAKDALASLIH